MQKSTPLFERVKRALEARERDYGDPQDNLEHVAKRWSIQLNQRISAKDVAIMMIDFKLSRLKHNPKHFDSLVDVVGYAACLAELQ